MNSLTPTKMPSSSEENSDIATNMSCKERALSIWVVTCGIGRTLATWVLSTAIMALRLVWWTSSDHSEDFKILVVGHFIEFSQVAIMRSTRPHFAHFLPLHCNTNNENSRINFSWSLADNAFLYYSPWQLGYLLKFSRLLKRCGVESTLRCPLVICDSFQLKVFGAPLIPMCGLFWWKKSPILKSPFSFYTNPRWTHVTSWKTSP